MAVRTVNAPNALVGTPETSAPGAAPTNTSSGFDTSVSSFGGSQPNLVDISGGTGSGGTGLSNSYAASTSVPSGPSAPPDANNADFGKLMNKLVAAGFNQASANLAAMKIFTSVGTDDQTIQSFLDAANEAVAQGGNKDAVLYDTARMFQKAAEKRNNAFKKNNPDEGRTAKTKREEREADTKYNPAA
ncbi:MAG: hypothetical protein ACKVPX_08395 [Myxococcaceae bacterium]